MKWNFAISGCCLLLLAANIELMHQNSELKSRLSQAPPTLEAASGSQMPDLHGFDLKGKPIQVDYGKDPRKVLLLVFSPTCPYCDENWPKWQQVISSINRSAIRPVAVDVTSTASTTFVSQHQLEELPVFLKVDPHAMVSYRLQLTPQTILVDTAGKVEKVWTGVLNDSAVAELRQRTGGSKAASENSDHHQGF
jgi:peroxiredoxin